MPDVPPVIADSAVAELEPILTAAFATLTGPGDLATIVFAATGIRIFENYGTAFTPMRPLIHKLCEDLPTQPDLFFDFLCGVYEALPGDPGLRQWIATHLPADAGRVSDDAFEAARDAYLAERQAGWQAAAIAGFGTLKEARSQPSIAAEIAPFQDRLRLARDKLQVLDCYKKLHDNLHNIQTQPLARFGEFMLERELDDLALAEIDRQTEVLATYLPLAETSIRLLRPGPERRDEEIWVPELRAAIATLRDHKPQTPEALRDATYELIGVLRFHMGRLNRLLVSAARAIPFAELAELLSRAAAASNGAENSKESATARPLENAAAALNVIGTRLAYIITIHDGWQNVEPQLWLMEGLVRAGALGSRAEMLSLWKQTGRQIELLKRIDPGEWAQQIEFDAARLDKELAADPADPRRLARAFAGYATRARSRFFLVDLTLLSECGAIVDLQPTLASLTVEGQ